MPLSIDPFVTLERFDCFLKCGIFIARSGVTRTFCFRLAAALYVQELLEIWIRFELRLFRCAWSRMVTDSFICFFVAMLSFVSTKWVYEFHHALRALPAAFSVLAPRARLAVVSKRLAIFNLEKYIHMFLSCKRGVFSFVPIFATSAGTCCSTDQVPSMHFLHDRSQ